MKTVGDFLRELQGNWTMGTRYAYLTQASTDWLVLLEDWELGHAAVAACSEEGDVSLYLLRDDGFIENEPKLTQVFR